MIFASYTYVAFLAIAFVLHWLLPARAQKPFLLLASYVFYCSWRWQYGFLLLAVSVFSWAYGLLLEKREGDSRLLFLGVAIELSPLLYFKYTGFLLDNVTTAARLLGADVQAPVLDIVLPLGISFFTFQGIAYLVDVASGEPPFRKLSDFLLFKGFWPQLIAGPILRPDEVKEQIETPRRLAYDDVAEGSRRVLLGLFKKMVLADAMAPYADMVFLPNAAPAALDGVFGVLAFGLQIYWDFSGYSDIAIGSARLFGYRFPENFEWPYAARSPQEFWARWHMTLSRWIRDYVFTPLTFAFRARPALGLVWLVVAMAVCGFWHGARWTFILWGVWHGLLLVLNQTWLKRLFVGTEEGRPARSSLRGLFAFAFTFVAVHVGWLLFRAETLTQAFAIGRAIVTLDGGLRPAILRENNLLLIALHFLGLYVSEVSLPYSGRLRAFFAERQRTRSVMLGAFYSLAIVFIVVFDQEATGFVYFQF